MRTNHTRGGRLEARGAGAHARATPRDALKPHQSLDPHAARRASLVDEQRRVARDRQICDEIVRVSTPEAVEMTKLLENIFRSVNIALVNELAMLSDRMGVDIWEVVDPSDHRPASVVHQYWFRVTK